MPKRQSANASYRCQVKVGFKKRSHDYISKLAKEAGITKAQFIRGIVLDVLADDAAMHGEAFER